MVTEVAKQNLPVWHAKVTINFPFHLSHLPVIGPCPVSHLLHLHILLVDLGLHWCISLFRPARLDSQTLPLSSHIPIFSFPIANAWLAGYNAKLAEWQPWQVIIVFMCASGFLIFFLVVSQLIGFSCLWFLTFSFCYIIYLLLAKVKVQKSEHHHCWDPCVSYCHTHHPGHCKTPTWNQTSSQDYCKCNVAYVSIFLICGVTVWIHSKQCESLLPEIYSKSVPWAVSSGPGLPFPIAKPSLPFSSEDPLLVFKVFWKKCIWFFFTCSSRDHLPHSQYSLQMPSLSCPWDIVCGIGVQFFPIISKRMRMKRESLYSAQALRKPFPIWQI